MTGSVPNKEQRGFSSEDLRRIADEVRAWFPRRTTQKEMVLLDIDPGRLLAYWHVPEAELADAFVRAGSPYAPMALRVYDVTDHPAGAARPSEWTEVDVPPGQDTAYAEVQRSGGVFVAEVGVRCADGKLLVLAHSNRATLPRAAPSPIFERRGIELRPRPSRPLTWEHVPPSPPHAPPLPVARGADPSPAGTGIDPLALIGEVELTGPRVIERPWEEGERPYPPGRNPSSPRN